MQVATTTCAAMQHEEFCIEVDPQIPQCDINSLISYLEQSVEKGVRFKVGQSIQLGSMILQIVASKDSLTLEEPDLLAIPIAWAPGVTRSLKLLRLHKDVVESVGLISEFDPPSIYDSLLVGVDLIEGKTNSFVLERVNSGGVDSGWFVGRLDTDLDYSEITNLRRISVYQAIVSWPAIAGFLAFPEGCRVETSGDLLEISRNGTPLQVFNGSLLSAAVAKQ